jgi:hypothetical protein
VITSHAKYSDGDVVADYERLVGSSCEDQHSAPRRVWTACSISTL